MMGSLHLASSLSLKSSSRQVQALVQIQFTHNVKGKYDILVVAPDAEQSGSLFLGQWRSRDILFQAPLAMWLVRWTSSSSFGLFLCQALEFCRCPVGHCHYSLTLTSSNHLTYFSAWAISGTPVDCVLLGMELSHWDSPPDLVLSGINKVIPFTFRLNLLPTRNFQAFRLHPHVFRLSTLGM